MTDQLLDLPFVRKLDGQCNYDLWNAPETGDYGLDCALGAMLALRTVSFMRETDDGDFLMQIVRRMAEIGRFGGVEIGFISTIGRASSLASDGGTLERILVPDRPLHGGRP